MGYRVQGVGYGVAGMGCRIEGAYITTYKLCMLTGCARYSKGTRCRVRRVHRVRRVCRVQGTGSAMTHLDDRLCQS